MSVSKEYLATYNAIKKAYGERLGADETARLAADIVKRDLAAIGFDGRVTFDPAVATIAPRLAPAVAINPDADERTKLAQYAALLDRQKDTLPAARATRSTTWDPSRPMREQLISDPKTDTEKAHNAAIFISRAEQANEVGE